MDPPRLLSLKVGQLFLEALMVKYPVPIFFTVSSQLFPPTDRMPPNTLSLDKSLWFNEGRRKTRTFLFDEKSIDALKSKVKSKSPEHPNRVQALTAFIWKYAMLASKSASGISKPSLCSHLVNIRRRLEPQLPDYSSGNGFWYTISPYKSADNDIDLRNLAYLVKELLETFDRDYLDRLQSGEGIKVISEKLNDLLAEFASGDIEFYTFSSWLNFFGFHELDFGWGEPSLHALPGIVSPTYTYSTILKGIGKTKAIEAWIKKNMAIVENDPKFLAFASSNPLSDKIKI